MNQASINIVLPDRIVTDPLLKRLSEFSRMSLEKAMAIDLNKRSDRKFLIPVDELYGQLNNLSQNWILQENACGHVLGDYITRYWDYPSMTCFRNHVLSRKHRFKVRKRLYQDTGDCLLEVKKKNKSMTIKSRNPSNFNDHLNETDIKFLESQGIVPDHMEPVLDITYQRITLWNRELSGRMTIDLSFSFSHGDMNRSFCKTAIIEMKGGKSHIQNAMRSFSIPMYRYQTSFSKFIIAYADMMGFGANMSKGVRTIHKTLLKLNAIP